MNTHFANSSALTSLAGLAVGALKNRCMYSRDTGKGALALALVLAMTTSMPLGAGLVSHNGRSVRAMLTKTQTNATTFSTPYMTWVPLSDSTITYFVPPGGQYVFNAFFSAECAATGGASLRIRIVDNGTPLHPNKGVNQVFCQSSSPATHAGKWVITPPAGNVDGGTVHKLTVEVLIGEATATLDDWTFEVVVYNR